MTRQFGVKSAEARLEYLVKNARWEKIEYKFDDGVIPDRSLAFSMAFGFTFKHYENTIFLFGGLGPCQDT